MLKRQKEQSFRQQPSTPSGRGERESWELTYIIPIESEDYNTSWAHVPHWIGFPFDFCGGGNSGKRWECNDNALHTIFADCMHGDPNRPGLFIKSQVQAATYYPAYDQWAGSLTHIYPDLGYFIVNQTGEDCEFTLTGNSIPDLTYQLYDGWNWVSFNHSSDQSGGGVSTRDAFCPPVIQSSHPLLGAFVGWSLDGDYISVYIDEDNWDTPLLDNWPGTNPMQAGEILPTMGVMLLTNDEVSDYTWCDSSGLKRVPWDFYFPDPTNWECGGLGTSSEPGEFCCRPDGHFIGHHGAECGCDGVCYEMELGTGNYGGPPGTQAPCNGSGTSCTWAAGGDCDTPVPCNIHYYPDDGETNYRALIDQSKFGYAYLMGETDPGDCPGWVEVYADENNPLEQAYLDMDPTVLKFWTWGCDSSDLCPCSSQKGTIIFSNSYAFGFIISIPHFGIAS